MSHAYATSIVVSTCGGAVFVTIPADEFAWLWGDVLALGAAGSRCPARHVADACHAVMRAIGQGRVQEFTTTNQDWDRRRLERRLLEFATIAIEADRAGQLVYWK